MDVTPETVATAVSNVASARGKGTLPNLMAFARALKQLGIKVSLSQVLDTSRAVELVDIGGEAGFSRAAAGEFDLAERRFPGL